MIDYKYADLFLKDNVGKQFVITTDDGAVTITNKELHQEQFELNESICSESTLRFGACEASSVKFRISNVFTSLKGKWITVSCILNGNTDEPFVFGRYKVDSDKPTADKRYRDIVAYDMMYDILSADVAEWYNSLTFPMPLKTFRNAFISHFNLEEVEIYLPNDEMTVERTIEPSEISGKDVLTAICEINGCFGHIGRDGKFEYIVLNEITKGLYPSNTLYPANDLFPRDTNAARIGSSKYIKATYEDFVVQKINSVQIRQEENDIGGTSGSGDNAYIIEDNFLVYGKSTDELNDIAAKFLSAVGVVVYRPSSATAIGNPCLEVGDPIKVSTKYQNIETYILSRTLKGIQGIKDTYSAKGAEYTDNKVNSVQRSIVQLKGKTNLLIRTVEETRLIITDVESGLKSEISQTASEIRGKVQDINNGLSASIQINSNAITSEVQRAQEAESNLGTRITQTESSITSEINSLDGRFNKIEQTIEGVTFQDEDGATKISGSVISTGTLIGVTALFTEHHSLFWACGTDNTENARNIAEWGCDSNAIFAHDENGNRLIELWRASGGKGSANFRSTVEASDFWIIGGQISLFNTYNLASGASNSISALESNVSSLENKVNSYASDISSLESDVSLLLGDLENVESNISSLSNKVSALDSEIVSTNSALDSAVSRIAANEKDIAVNDKTVAGLETRLSAVEAALGL